jgi:hypothetical protein
VPDDGSDEPKRVVRCRTANLLCISTLRITDAFQAANEVLENLVYFEHQLRTKCRGFFYDSGSLYVNRHPLKYVARVFLTLVK